MDIFLQRQGPAFCLVSASTLFAPLYVFLPVFTTTDVLMLNALACIIPGGLAVVWPEKLLELFRAKRWVFVEYDFATDFMQAWGLFACALGAICLQAWYSEDVLYRTHVSYVIVGVTILSIGWDVKLGLSTHYGSFGFFAAAFNFWIAIGNIIYLK